MATGVGPVFKDELSISKLEILYDLYDANPPMIDSDDPG
jgi:hypothetical protein